MSDEDDWFERAIREGEGDERPDEYAEHTDADEADETEDYTDEEEHDETAGATDAADASDADDNDEVAVDVDEVADAGSTDEDLGADDAHGQDATETTGGQDSESQEPVTAEPADSQAWDAEDFDDNAADGPRSDVGDEDENEQDWDNSPGFESPDDSGDDADPFEQDFGEAFENAPGPEQGGFPGSGGLGQSPTNGGGDAGSGDFGFSEFGDGADGFEETPGGLDETAFDEESFDSELDRLDIGIEGLDNMILGGIPRRSLMVAVGSAGTGKTTFGLQFLNHGLEQGESAVYITLEESYDRILDTASEKGWDFEGYVEDDQLAIVDIDPVEMANSLDSIQNDLPGLIEGFGADRLVLDSVSLLEMMYEHAPKRRSQVFGFTRALKRAGITTLMTSEASEDNPYASRFGIVEYLADAVFVLQYIRGSDFRETRLAIEIQKIRDANHSRATKPYELTESGISVYRQANIF